MRAVACFSAMAVGLFVTLPAAAAPFNFSSGEPDGLIATGARPDGPDVLEVETGDDFVLNGTTSLTSASFFGLVPAGAELEDIIVEIYRVFPKDSTTPPSGAVPTRDNSPSDVEFVSRESADGTLRYTTTITASDVTVANSVLNGINPIPDQTTGGEGPVTGEQIRIDVEFADPISLPADHYFFVPQVALEDDNFSFLWLSAARPIEMPGTPFTPDLQTWIRDGDLDPDWLRIGTDIIGGDQPPTFNAAFALEGVVVPIPAAGLLFATAISGLGLLGWRTRSANGPEQAV